MKALTNRLDASQPLYITDGFLNDVWSACALRSDADRAPLHSSFDGADCLRAPATQPCLRSVLEQPDMCRSSVMRDNSPGTWAQNALQVGAYGNSGSIMSRGLLASLSASDFEACEKCNSSSFTCMHGADFRIGECFLAFAANGQGIGPTLPGLHPNGFRQFGHPAESVLALSQAVVAGGACDEHCTRVLSNVITSPVSAHGKTKDAYWAELATLYDTYTQAKALLQARKARAAAASTAAVSFSMFLKPPFTPFTRRALT